MRFTRLASFLALLALTAGIQFFYDKNKIAAPFEFQSFSPRVIKKIDLGLHSAAASFLWIQTRTELPFLPFGYNQFAADLNLINDLDPRFSEPYAFTVVVLESSTKYPNRVSEAIRIGKKGTEEADPDWRIPFYTAAIYHLDLRDRLNAARYFDIAGRTPGAPDAIKRFALNYGILPNELKETKQIWQAIYESSKDDGVRKQAKAHIEHIQIIEFLAEAVGQYKAKYNKGPEKIEDLISKNIIRGIPSDPFGFEFQIFKGGLVGIKPAGF